MGVSVYDSGKLCPAAGFFRFPFRFFLLPEPVRMLVPAFFYRRHLLVQSQCCLLSIRKSLHRKVEHLPMRFRCARTALRPIVLFALLLSGCSLSLAQEPEKPNAPEPAQSPVKQN